MTREEMFGLAAGEMVVVKGSGKVYRVCSVRLTGIYSLPGEPLEVGCVSFVSQRNGKDFGPQRKLKPENIEKVAVAAEQPAPESAPRMKEWKLSDLRKRSAAGLTGANLFK